MISIIFWILFSLAGIGFLIDSFEILPTVIKKRGEKKDDWTTSDKACRRNIEEYHAICKELKKPLLFYHYMKWLDKHLRHAVYIFVFVTLFSMIMAFL